MIEWFTLCDGKVSSAHSLLFFYMVGLKVFLRPGADTGGWGGQEHPPPLFGTPKLYTEGKKRCVHAHEWPAF